MKALDISKYSIDFDQRDWKKLVELVKINWVLAGFKNKRTLSAVSPIKGETTFIIQSYNSMEQTL